MNLQTPTLDAAVESLRAEVTGSVSLPGETGYELAIPWNAAVPVAPGAVVAVESAQDIVATAGSRSASSTPKTALPESARA